MNKHEEVEYVVVYDVSLGKIYIVRWSRQHYHKYFDDKYYLYGVYTCREDAIDVAHELTANRLYWDGACNWRKQVSVLPLWGRSE